MFVASCGAGRAYIHSTQPRHSPTQSPHAPSRSLGLLHLHCTLIQPFRFHWFPYPFFLSLHGRYCCPSPSLFVFRCSPPSPTPHATTAQPRSAIFTRTEHLILPVTLTAVLLGLFLCASLPCTTFQCAPYFFLGPPFPPLLQLSSPFIPPAAGRGVGAERASHPERACTGRQRSSHPSSYLPLERKAYVQNGLDGGGREASTFLKDVQCAARRVASAGASHSRRW